MKTFPLLIICVLALFCHGCREGRSTGAGKKVLVFTKSSGFEHDAFKVDTNPTHGFGFRVLKEIGEGNAIAFTFSKDGSLFTPEYLAQFDAFLFYTTGDLTLARNNARYGDDNPPMTPEGKAALLKAIESGKGFVGLHCAADTFHSPGGKDDEVPARYENDGDKTDAFLKMMGGEFIKHDSQQKARQVVFDAKFPGMGALPPDFGPHEEWYSLKNFGSDIHVLLVQDTSTMKGRSYERPPFPSTWARMHGKGRVFYSSMGHREDVWTNPGFQAVLLGGLNWATGRIKAKVTPNLAQAAPQAHVLPKYVPPAPKKEAAPSAATPAKQP